MFALVLPRIRLVRSLSSFWYSVPSDFTPHVGDLVEIPWRKSFVIGVVIRLDVAPPNALKCKPLERVLSPKLFSEQSLLFLHWFARFYAVSPALGLKTLFPDVPRSFRKKPLPPFGAENFFSGKPDQPHSSTQKNVPVLQDAIQFLQNPTKPLLLRYVRSSDLAGFYYALLKKHPRSTLILCPTVSSAEQLAREFSWCKPILFHSDFTPKELWIRFCEASAKNTRRLIIGTKSALTFALLGAVETVIVHDEDSAHHRNYDQNPRYAVHDALLHAFPILFSRLIFTARVPRITTSFASQAFFLSAPLPSIRVINLEEERLAKRLSIISEPLFEALRTARKFFFFVNRIGYARYLVCRSCHRLYPLSALVRCSVCQSTDLRPAGFGTEKFLESLQKLFPERIVAIIDRNNPQLPEKYDFLIGTEKSFSLVDFSQFDGGVICHADSLLAHTSWRASERAFALISFLRSVLPNLFIQTFSPNSHMLHYILNNDYASFFQEVLPERKMFSYPPYAHIISLLRHGKPPQISSMQNDAFPPKDLPPDVFVDLDPDTLS